MGGSMSVILRDLLLFCCLAAFYTGDRARGGKPAQLTLGAVPPAHAPGSARPGALTHHSWSCLSSRGCPWGCRGLGLGTPSRSDNALPREGVPGSTDHGLEKPAGGGLLPVGRTSGEAAACGLEPAHRLWRRRGGPAGMEELLRLLPHLVHVPAEEARRLRERPAVVEFVLEVADIGLGLRCA